MSTTTSLAKPPHPALNMGVLSAPTFDDKQWRRALIAADHAFKKETLLAKQSKAASQHPPATSVLLQGNPRHATRALFLFPDGSGSAASYTLLSLISPSIVVYGLNCPYLKTPEDWKCGPQDLTPLFLAEIRRRQPQGPYYLGGYSTGGIGAFGAAQAFDRAGETVERLILIDSPCPIHIQRLPPMPISFLQDVHAFNSRGRQPPRLVFPHVEANTEALQKCRVRPFEAYREPSTHIIYARFGVCESDGFPQMEILGDDPKEMK